MIYTVLAALALAVSASSAFALLDDTVDALGIFFDQGLYDENCIEVVDGEPFDVYFVLGHCQLGVRGFEFAWRMEPAPSVTILNTTLPPRAVNLGTSTNFLVGLGTPLVTSDATVLVTLRLLTVGVTAGTHFQLGPATPSSIGGHMAFNPGEDIGIIFPMVFPAYDGLSVDASGWSVPGVATIGCPGPSPTAAQSWSAIKALCD
jgi:hypothetical protein